MNASEVKGSIQWDVRDYKGIVPQKSYESLESIAQQGTRFRVVIAVIAAAFLVCVVARIREFQRARKHVPMVVVYVGVQCFTIFLYCFTDIVENLALQRVDDRLLCNAVGIYEPIIFTMSHVMFYFVLHERHKSTRSLHRPRYLDSLASLLVYGTIGSMLAALGSPLLASNGVLVHSVLDQQDGSDSVCFPWMNPLMIGSLTVYDTLLSLGYLVIFVTPIRMSLKQIETTSSLPGDKSKTRLQQLAWNNVIISGVQMTNTTILFSWTTYVASRKETRVLEYYFAISVLPPLDLFVALASLFFLTKIWIPTRLIAGGRKVKKTMTTRLFTPNRAKTKNHSASSIGGLSQGLSSTACKRISAG